MLYILRSRGSIEATTSQWVAAGSSDASALPLISPRTALAHLGVAQAQ